MKPFLENTDLEELEQIQHYMDEHGISDPEKLTLQDYVLIEISRSEKEDPTNNLANRLDITFQHMIKFKYQPESQSTSWVGSIYPGCELLSKVNLDSDLPKLDKKGKYNSMDDFIQHQYEKARYSSRLQKDTGLDPKAFPKTAKEAFGDCANPEHLSDWSYMKRNFIERYATEKSKDDVINVWDRHKWDKKDSKKYKK